MKLGVVFNVFDGEELLEDAVARIAHFSSYIILICQGVSNHGIENYAGAIECQRLNNLGFVDEVMTFTPDLSQSPYTNELEKRNLGLHVLRKVGCTHFLMMDVDEFYRDTEAANAIQAIKDYDYGVTYCRLYTYYKYPVVQLTPMEEYFVPFICKLTDDVSLGGPTLYEAPLVDPTRRIRPVTNMHVFEQDVLTMHHMTFVRRDLEKKMRNSSACTNKSDMPIILSAYDSFKLGQTIPVLFYKQWWNIRYVEDIFNLMPLVEQWTT